MSQADPIELLDGIGIFRPVGIYRFQQVVALVTEIIVQLRERGVGKLIVVTHGVSGFQPPSLSERHWMVREWVEASQGKLKVAMVVPEEFIDPEKFGVLVAANFGVTSDVFTSEADAMKWLREQP
ncbi:MAG: hypothetical protein ACREPB_00130 [Arenimonas sp.]